MPLVVSWPMNRSQDALADRAGTAITACRHALLRDELVVLPTECGYVGAASALRPEAVARLASLRAGTAPLPAVAVRGAADARDWVPEPGTIGRRLAERCWPGPLVLVFAKGVKLGAATRLPDGVLRMISPGRELGLTAPEHAVVRNLLDRVAGPLLLGEMSADPVATPEAVHAAIGDAAAVIIDAGPIQVEKSATVIEVRGGAWTVRRDGALPAAEITLLAATTVLFVCTGNTCRSPLAEALCKTMLADRLGTSIEDLPARGFVISSAGLAAVRGEPAAAEAVVVARDLGADLSGHASRPATPDVLTGADVIVAMTAGHLHGMTAFGGSDANARLLCGESDLADPIGGDLGVYQACAGTIWQNLQGFVEELVAGRLAANPPDVAEGESS
jgi:protein-tyrosine phosphatase